RFERAERGHGRHERVGRRGPGAHLPHRLRPFRVEPHFLFLPRGVLRAPGVRRALLLGLALSVWGAWERSAAAQQGDSTPRPLPRQRFWVRPAASLLLPGAGQFLAHEERGAIYVAAEVYSLARIIQLNRKGRRAGQRFPARAFTDARP